MLLVDLASPYEYGWRGSGSSYAFHVDFDRLGLGMDTIRAAWLRLDATPLYPVVRDHILHITTRAEQLSADPAASQLAAATVEMMRALIVSAAQDQRLLADAMATSLVPRILAYARHHLTEDDLVPARIAAAHNISVRYLYKPFEKEDTSLEQWIIQHRLEGGAVRHVQRHRRHIHSGHLHDPRRDQLRRLLQLLHRDGVHRVPEPAVIQRRQRRGGVRPPSRNPAG